MGHEISNAIGSRRDTKCLWWIVLSICLHPPLSHRQSRNWKQKLIGNGGTVFYVIQSPLEKALNLLTAITLADLLETRWILQGRHRVEVADCHILIQESKSRWIFIRAMLTRMDLRREKGFFCFWFFDGMILFLVAWLKRVCK